MNYITGEEIFDEIKKLQDNGEDRFLTQFTKLCSKKYVLASDLEKQDGTD